jgi:hypothetical protein
MATSPAMPERIVLRFTSTLVAPREAMWQWITSWGRHPMRDHALLRDDDAARQCAARRASGGLIEPTDQRR